MKAIRLVDREELNPDWDRLKALRARLNGDTYDVEQFHVLKAGSEISGPNAKLHCLLPTPLAVPADDECREAVLKALSSEQLKHKMEEIRKYGDDPERLKKAPRQRQAVVRALVDMWDGTQLQALILGEDNLPDAEFLKVPSASVLIAAGISSLDQLREVIATDKWHESIPGIGDKTAEAIEENLTT